MLEIAVQEEACRADRRLASERFEAIRRKTESLTANLTAEDQSIQSMPDVSPTKWHLAHTTWFFETFLLARFDPGYRVFDPPFGYLFNSYYEAVGPRHPRPERGLLSRPTVDIVMAYRDHVGSAMARLVERVAEPEWSEVAAVLELGIHHEQQHQELILMDIKHVFSLNPLLPAYEAPQLQVQAAVHPLTWVDFAGGLKEIGHAGSGFAFD
ncbi:MAG: DinB family protein, partial [Stellaceae bacterium]